MGALIGLLVWAGVTWASYAVGKSKNRGTAGLLLGLFLGLLGLIIIACLKPRPVVPPAAGYYPPPQPYHYAPPPASATGYYPHVPSAPPTTKIPRVPATTEPDWTDLKPRQ